MFGKPNWGLAVFLRADRLMDNGGVVRSASTYSLIVKDETLFLVRTGPAWRITHSSLLADLSITRTIKGHTRRIEAGEAALPPTFQELARKASMSAPLQDVDAFTLSHNPVWDRGQLRLKVGGLRPMTRTLRVEFADQNRAVLAIGAYIKWVAQAA